jgi:hypothetical protein
VPTNDPATPKPDTSNDSATKAPENREHVESRARTKNDTLLPGGPHRATAEIGMQELNREDVPTKAEKSNIPPTEHKRPIDGPA